MELVCGSSLPKNGLEFWKCISSFLEGLLPAPFPPPSLLEDLLLGFFVGEMWAYLFHKPAPFPPPSLLEGLLLGFFVGEMWAYLFHKSAPFPPPCLPPPQCFFVLFSSRHALLLVLSVRYCHTIYFCTKYRRCAIEKHGRAD